jgi:hypothetical protein
MSLFFAEWDFLRLKPGEEGGSRHREPELPISDDSDRLPRNKAGQI